MAEISGTAGQVAHQVVRVEGAHLVHRVSFWKRKGFLFLNLSFGTARAGGGQVSRRALRALLVAQKETPAYLTHVGPTGYWMYRDEVFAGPNGLDSEGVEKDLEMRRGAATGNRAGKRTTP